MKQLAKAMRSQRPSLATGTSGRYLQNMTRLGDPPAKYSLIASPCSGWLPLGDRVTTLGDTDRLLQATFG